MHASTAANVEAVWRGTRCTGNLECDPRCGYECDVEGENGPCPEALEVFGPANGRVRTAGSTHEQLDLTKKVRYPSTAARHEALKAGRCSLRGSLGTTGVGLTGTLSALVARGKVARFAAPQLSCTQRFRKADQRVLPSKVVALSPGSSRISVGGGELAQEGALGGR
ncbi:hypothetical protein B0H10DRAFT_1955764 [Mycena sp. CBHHK59/15]|nr:hypothetical protein B0H10DRAFT_1955764 [Mycena sp. CBHHK59/15]